MDKNEWNELRKKAKAGCRESEWNLAECYFDGVKNEKGNIIVRKNNSKALHWLMLSAEKGYPYAQNNLGVILSNGLIVQKNIKEAIFWLKKAHKGGDFCAASNLGLVYRESNRHKLAMRWFQNAFENGDESTLLYIGEYYFEGIHFDQDLNLAIKYFRRLIKSNNVEEYTQEKAMCWLGIAYWKGKGVKRSLTKARQLFMRANRDKDNPEAEELLREITKE